MRGHLLPSQFRLFSDIYISQVMSTFRPLLSSISHNLHPKFDLALPFSPILPFPILAKLFDLHSCAPTVAVPYQVSLSY